MKKILLLLSLILYNCSQHSKINANKFNTGINSTNINLIDVRTYDEFALGHIPNSINIDFNNFDEFKENIDLIDKNKATYIYCLSGGRSSKAYAYLSEKGFTNLYELDGGIMSWRKNSFPERNLISEVDELTLNDFNKLIDSDKLVMISVNANWCAPCIKMKPTLKKLSVEKDKEVSYHSINYDTNKGLMALLKIYSLPSIKFYKNEKLIYSINDLIDEDSLRNIISNLID